MSPVVLFVGAIAMWFYGEVHDDDALKAGGSVLAFLAFAAVLG